jgi:hypothetical protein
MQAEEKEHGDTYASAIKLVQLQGLHWHSAVFGIE